MFVLCSKAPPHPPFIFLVYSCSSFLFLITPLRSLPPPSLCLLFVLQAAGRAVLPFVTPTGSSGEDRPSDPTTGKGARERGGKGESQRALQRWEQGKIIITEGHDNRGLPDFKHSFHKSKYKSEYPDAWQIKGKANIKGFSKVLGHFRPPEKLYCASNIYLMFSWWWKWKCRSKTSHRCSLMLSPTEFEG